MPFITARVVSVIRTDTGAALANAGADQSVLCASLVTLAASIIGDDIANHTFEWEQTFGTTVVLINPLTLTPSFVNPQTTDIEFTFYLDRNTPFEDSDTVFISRRPQSAVATSNISTQADKVYQISAASGAAQVSTQSFFDANAKVFPLAYDQPPATYSPIYTAEDLDRIREWRFAKYWLMNDIDLSGYANWNPIGTATQPFTGEFQGNGFAIDNLTITDRVQNSGLFGQYDGATIENLGVTNANVTGQTSSWYSSILAGNGNAGPDAASIIRNCYTTGVIDSDGDRAGGFIGYPGTNVSSVYENNYADVTVTGGGTRTGGFLGYFEAEPTYIENYSNTTKTALVVGTLAPDNPPGATEISGLETVEFYATSSYVGWDFDTIWDEPTGTWIDTLLLHMDGTDESTSFVDSGILAVTPLTAYGSTDMDNTQAKFGPTSMFNGTADSGNGLAVPQNGQTTGSYLIFGGAWTIECWYYQTANSEFNFSSLISRVFTGDRTDASDSTIELGVNWNAPNVGEYTPYLLTNLNNTGNHQLVNGTETTLLNEWNHVAVTRDSDDNLRMFVNGVLSESGVDAGVAVGVANRQPYIGASDGGGTRRHSFHGWIDEVRVTDGLARYTKDFTVPTAPFVAENVTDQFSPATLQEQFTGRLLDTTCDSSMVSFYTQLDVPNRQTGFDFLGKHIGYKYKFVGTRTERLEGTNWVHDAFTPGVQRHVPIEDGKALRATWRWNKTFNDNVIQTINTLHPKSFASAFGSSRPGGSALATTSFQSSQASQVHNLVIDIQNPTKITKFQTEPVNNLSSAATQSNQIYSMNLQRFKQAAKTPDLGGENVVTSLSDAQSQADAIYTLVVTRTYGGAIGGG